MEEIKNALKDKTPQELEELSNVNKINDNDSIPSNDGINSKFVLPELTEEHLPKILYEYGKDISYRKDNSPIEYSVVAMIVLIGSLIGAKAVIHPKCLDYTFKVFANLWGLIVGDPSIKKTPNSSEVFYATDNIVKKIDEENRNNLSEFAVECEIYNANSKSLKDKLKKDNNKDNNKKIEEELKNLKVPISPKQKRLYVNDFTITALQDILMDNSNGILINTDEIKTLWGYFERAGNEGAREDILESFNGGVTNKKVDRAKSNLRGATNTIPRWMTSIFGTTQPSTLANYVNRAMSGVQNDGFLQRHQLLVYPEPKAYIDVNKVPNKDLKEKFQHLVETIINTDKFDYSMPDKFQDLDYYLFSDESQKLYSDWKTKLNKESRDEDLNPAIKSHLGKFESLVPSLSLIYHIINVVLDNKNCSSHISVEVTQKAINMANLLKLHMYKVYNLKQKQFNQSEEKIEILLEFIGKSNGNVKTREATHKTKMSKPEIEKALKNTQYKIIGSSIRLISG